MKCMYCGAIDSKVIDSRAVDETNAIRRRRECLGCGKRFTTYETIETTPIMVVKNNGEREQFDINKVKRGIIKSCEKRPVTMSQIDSLVAEIEKKVYNNLEEATKKVEKLEKYVNCTKNAKQLYDFLKEELLLYMQSLAD